MVEFSYLMQLKMVSMTYISIVQDPR